MAQAYRTLIMLLALGFAFGLNSNAAKAADKNYSKNTPYTKQLRLWTSPEQVQSWIKDRFLYDRDRAVALSETQRSKGAPFAIYQPSDFYRKPTGICVDLSRFAVETVNNIAPSLDAKYLRITFDPVSIRGNVLRMHWLASFQRAGKYYFFADSRHPAALYGPFDQVRDFIRSYQDAGNRKIISYKLVNSYRKERRKMRRKKARS